MQVRELQIVQRYHILGIICDRDVCSDLMRAAERGGRVGKYRVAELERIHTRGKIADGVRAEVRLEYERVSTGAGSQHIVRAANQRRGAAASGECLTT